MKKTLRKTDPFVLLMGATLSWLAVVLQFYLIIENREVSVPETIVRFFSFFTILTNTLVAICFTILYQKTSSRIYLFISRSEVLTAVAVYITVVGLVYQMILRATWSPEGLQFLVDELLHSVLPLYFLLYWIFYVPKDHIQWKHIPSWLLYPSIYFIYILLRGMFSGFYPYPFIDVSESGYAVVFMNGTILLGLFAILSVCFIAISKISRKTRASSTVVNKSE